MAIILIVDDEEIDRVLETAILGTAGHELLYAADGQAAHEVLRDKDVDLVITDLAMPESSGLRLIRELRGDGFDVPIIAVSGWAADQLDLAESYGADFTLFKPVDGHELLRVVEEALTGTPSGPPTDLFGVDRPLDRRDQDPGGPFTSD